MSIFKLAVTCPVCEEVIVQNDYCVDSTVPDKVVNLDMFACERFECDNCGTVVYTGDVEDMCEYEEENLDEPVHCKECRYKRPEVYACTHKVIGQWCSLLDIFDVADSYSCGFGERNEEVI